MSVHFVNVHLHNVSTKVELDYTASTSEFGWLEVRTTPTRVFFKNDVRHLFFNQRCRKEATNGKRRRLFLPNLRTQAN